MDCFLERANKVLKLTQGEINNLNRVISIRETESIITKTS